MWKSLLVFFPIVEMEMNTAKKIGGDLSPLFGKRSQQKQKNISTNTHKNHYFQVNIAETNASLAVWGFVAVFGPGKNMNSTPHLCVAAS